MNGARNASTVGMLITPRPPSPTAAAEDAHVALKDETFPLPWLWSSQHLLFFFNFFSYLLIFWPFFVLVWKKNIIHSWNCFIINIDLFLSSGFLKYNYSVILLFELNNLNSTHFAFLKNKWYWSLYQYWMQWAECCGCIT